MEKKRNKREALFIFTPGIWVALEKNNRAFPPLL